MKCGKKCFLSCLQTEKERRRTVWQSPLFYQMGIDKSPFFVRNVGLLRAYFMMGLLVPMNINTMSVFSLTLWLYETGKCQFL